MSIYIYIEREREREIEAVINSIIKLKGGYLLWYLVHEQLVTSVAKLIKLALLFDVHEP
jgi:hypothetical protein